MTVVELEEDRDRIRRFSATGGKWVATISSPSCPMLLPHHGGKTANPSWLYSWARPQTVVVSQRMPVLGTNDALTLLERSGTPLLRTGNAGPRTFDGARITSSRKGSWITANTLDRKTRAGEEGFSTEPTRKAVFSQTVYRV